MKYECLKLEERRIIEEMYAKGAKPGEIAERVGKCQATIYRELERGKTGETDSRFRQGYSAAVAEARVNRSYSRRDQGYTVERGHGLRRRRSPSRWPLLLQGHYPQRSTLFQGRVSSARQGYSRQRQRGDERLLYHVRHERDDLYRVPLQFRRMAHHERVYLGERVYRVVRYQARQEHGLISTHDGRRARTARLPLW